MSDVFEKQAQELCDTEGKYATKKVVKNGIHYCLCATPLAIEGEVEDKITDCFAFLADAFKIPYDDSDAVDYVSEVRDELLDAFEKLVKGKIVYGYIEY